MALDPGCIPVGVMTRMCSRDAVKFYSPFSGLLVVRCDEAQHRNVWAAATLITEVRRRVVTVRLVVLTGVQPLCCLRTHDAAVMLWHSLCGTGSWLGACLTTVAVPTASRDAGVLQEEGGRVQRHRAASFPPQQAGDFERSSRVPARSQSHLRVAQTGNQHQAGGGFVAFVCFPDSRHPAVTYVRHRTRSSALLPLRTSRS